MKKQVYVIFYVETRGGGHCGKHRVKKRWHPRSHQERKILNVPLSSDKSPHLAIRHHALNSLCLSPKHRRRIPVQTGNSNCRQRGILIVANQMGNPSQCSFVPDFNSTLNMGGKSVKVILVNEVLIALVAQSSGDDSGCDD
jgi:hypothetical protein